MLPRFFIAALAFSTLLTACAGSPPRTRPTPARALLAISKTTHQLAIVDPASLEVVARLPIGPDPHEVVAAPDGATAYVSNTGSGLFHEINVLDLENQRALPSIDTGALIGPHGMQFAGGKLWFTAEGAKAIGRYDPAAARIDLVVGIGENRTHMLQVAAGNERIYATNVDSGSLAILENKLLPPPIPPIGAPLPTAKPQWKWVQTLVPTGKGGEGFDVSPDGRELWVANALAGTITVVDTQAKRALRTIDAKTLGISRVKFTADGSRVLVSSLRTGELLLFDAATKKEIRRLKLGKGAAHILLDPSAERAFVSCTPDGYIAVVDLRSFELSAKLDVGLRPDGLDWAVREVGGRLEEN